MASINEEIAIRGPDLGFGQDFRHADQAGIGEIHGGIRIFIEKFPDCHSLLLEIERGADQSRCQKERVLREDGIFLSKCMVSAITASQVMRGGENCLKHSTAHV